MLSTAKIKEIREKTISTDGDELIGVQQVCMDEGFEESNKRMICGLRSDQFVKFIKKIPNYEGHELSRESVDVEDFAQHNQANFAWTEEDGNIATLVADFNIDLDSNINKVTKQEPDTTTSSGFDSSMLLAARSNFLGSSTVSSSTGDEENSYCKKPAQLKIQKDDPRSRQHFVKFVKRHGRNMKLWECGICSREFQHQYTLMRHLPTHTDERNFHCNFCGKSFRQHSTLSQHKAIHSAERPYSCEVCEKTFNRVSTLISHRKTHSGEKPYKCNICPKSFHQKGNLRNHMFTHTNERPYRCNICSKGFNQQSNLVCHKLKAHPQYEDNQRTGKLPEYICPSEGPRAEASVARSPNILRKSHLTTWQKSNSINIKSVQKNIGKIRNIDEASATILKESNSMNAEKTAIEVPNTIKVETETPEYIQIDLNAIPNYQVDMTLASKSGTLKSKNGSAPILLKLVNVESKQNKIPTLIQANDNKVESKIVTFNNRVNHTKRSELQIRIPLATSVIPPTKNAEVVRTVNDEILSKPAPVSTDAMFGEGCVVHLESSVAAESSSRIVVKHEPSEDRENLTKELIGLDDVILSNDTNLILRSGCSPSVLGSALALDLLAPSDLFDPMDSIPIGPQLTPVDSSSDDADMLIGDWKNYFQFSDSDDATIED